MSYLTEDMFKKLKYVYLVNVVTIQYLVTITYL